MVQHKNADYSGIFFNEIQIQLIEMFLLRACNYGNGLLSISKSIESHTPTSTGYI